MTVRVELSGLAAGSGRYAQLGEDIYAGNGCYLWSWAEPICAVDDPQAAANKITSVLRAVPEPACS